MFLTNIRLNAIFSGGTFEEEHGRKKATSCACASTGVRSTLRRRDCRRPGQVLLKTCGAKFAREGVWPRLTPLPSAAGPRRCRATPCWELGFTSRHDSQAGRASPAAECSSCTARGFGYRLRPGRCRPDTRLGSQRAGSRVQVPSGRRKAAYLGSLPAGGPGLVLQTLDSSPVERGQAAAHPLSRLTSAPVCRQGGLLFPCAPGARGGSTPFAARAQDLLACAPQAHPSLGEPGSASPGLPVSGRF